MRKWSRLWSIHSSDGIASVVSRILNGYKAKGMSQRTIKAKWCLTSSAWPGDCHPALNSLQLLLSLGFSEARRGVHQQLIMEFALFLETIQQPLNILLFFVNKMLLFFHNLQRLRCFPLLEGREQGLNSYCSWKGAWPSPGPLDNSKDQTSVGDRRRPTSLGMNTWH